VKPYLWKPWTRGLQVFTWKVAGLGGHSSGEVARSRTIGSQLDLFKNQFLSEAGVAAWATWVVFFLTVVRDFEEAVSGRPPCV
jgi:hypothetical protein